MMRELRIVNEKGLHARASARFVKVTEQYEAHVEVSKDGNTVSGDSILGLMTLGASLGTSIAVSASGPQAEAVLDALTALVENGFDEG
jgi:phosphocarrier protein HPr